MITNLQIENFKGWRDTGPLRLAPITVFFGTNSSGKSSIGQFLMMLKQTANSSDRSRVLHPGDANTPVDLGTFEDIAYQHRVADPVRFRLEWRRPTPLKITDVINGESFSARDLIFETKIGFENGKGVRAVSRGFSYQFQELE